MLLEVHRLFNTVWSAAEEAWENTEKLRRGAANFVGMGDPLDKRIVFKEMPLEVTTVQLDNVHVPGNILELVLKKLSLKEVLSARLVCKAFNKFASRISFWNSFDLKYMFPKAKFLLNEGDQPVCSMEDYIVIKRMATLVEGNKNITFLSVSEKESLNEYANLNNVTVMPSIKEEIGNATQRSIMAISNGVIAGSKDATLERRKKIVENLHCEPATALALTALGIRQPEGEQIFDTNTASVCVDQKLEGKKIYSVVGGNQEKGLYVYDFDLSVDHEQPFHGIACMRILNSK
jgi:hypothetical protein